MDPFTAFMIAGALASVASTYSAVQASEAQSASLKIKAEQEKLAQGQRNIERNRNLKKLFSHQMAVQAANQGSFSSSNFLAIQQNTLDEYSRDVNADNLNSYFTNAAFDQSINNVNDTIPIQVAQGALKLGKDATSFYYHNPSTELTV
jgi:aspartokinase-like uncharacterized kinase